MAMGDHLRHHRRSGEPSMAAVRLGPGGPASTTTYSAADDLGNLFCHGEPSVA